MKLATPIGATSGKRVQVSLPAVVSIVAVGWADVGAAGFAAAVAGFLAGAVFGAGVVCDHPAKHSDAINKHIEKQIRIDAPDRRASPGRTAKAAAPTWFVMTAKYDSILRSGKSY
jgi:hypothetical protein